MPSKKLKAKLSPLRTDKAAASAVAAAAAAASNGSASTATSSASSIFQDNYAVIVLKIFGSPLSPMSSPTFGGNSRTSTPPPPIDRRQPCLPRPPSLSKYIQPTKGKDPPDRRKYCGFDMHVINATQLAAFFGLFFGIFRLFIWSVQPQNGEPNQQQDFDLVGPLLHNLIMLCANGLLLCAISLQMAALVVPFLVVNPVSLFLLLRFTSNVFAILSEWPLLDTLLGIGPLANAMANEDERQLASVGIRLSLLWLLILSLAVFLLCWLQCVIFRAFLFIRQSAKREKEKQVYRNVYCVDSKVFNGLSGTKNQQHY